MKRILFVALATLIFTACAGRSGSSGSGGTDALTTSCAENQELVNGVCACVSGYAADTNGDCLLKLATPSMPSTSSSTSSFVIKFNTVKDSEGNTISGAKIHYVKVLMSTSLSTLKSTCNAQSMTVDCESGISISPNASGAALSKGSYCLKAIACASGYAPSDLFTTSLNVGLLGTIEDPGNTTIAD